MGRRVSSGKVGAPALGGILADAQTITTDIDTDIIFDPFGTGRVLVEGHLQVQNQSNIRFGDADDSNYVAFQSPATVSADVTWTLPDADGTSGYVLTTNGAGVLSWTQKSVNIASNNSDSNNNYLVFTDATSGAITEARIDNSSLTYQPSTGTFTCTNLSATTITETSSIVFKENLNPLESVLNKIDLLNAYVYDRKDGSSTNEVGLIAEDVYEYIPNIVTLDDKGNPYGIQYSRLVPFLVECIKELKSKIERIEKA